LLNVGRVDCAVSMSNDYYTRRTTQLLIQFDEMATRLTEILTRYYGFNLADSIMKESRREYENLIPDLPYIGGDDNSRLTAIMIFSGHSLALYRAMKRHGRTAEEIGRIIYENAETQLKNNPQQPRQQGQQMLTEELQKRLKEHAKKSQQRTYSYDWVFSFVEGDGKEFDFGFDYTECGICKFYKSQGAEELTPYLCLLDYPKYKALGIQLTRTKTIADGAGICDFRFKKSQLI